MKKYTLMGKNILSCPNCSGNLILKDKQLYCVKCSLNYPIINDVPVLLLNLPKDVEKTKKTFTSEWETFDYNEATTWRMDAERRKNNFLWQNGITDKKVLKGKLLLDAGCGNGILTTLLTDYGLDVVGMDLSDSVFKAKSIFNKIPFVQGSVLTPPFKERAFDFVYSEGVLHHTPDSRKSFNQLARLVKKDGRMFIWLYLKRSRTNQNKIKLAVFDSMRFVICRSPLFIQKIVIEWIGLPLAMFLQNIGLAKRKDTCAQKLLLLKDGFTPRYARFHTPEEVENWFKEEGFYNINLSDTTQGIGFGMYGIKG